MNNWRHFYGEDWPPLPDGKGGEIPITKEFAGLMIGKKWRFFRDEQGIEFKDPWVPWMEAAQSLLGPDNLKVTPWTEQHMHDFVMEDKLIEWGCASCEKSHILGLDLVLFYLVDPFDTVILLGSTTKDALKSRSWNSIQYFHAALKKNLRGFLIPGKITKAGYALVNVNDEDSPESAGDKAGIQGRALNEDGNLQGAHAKYVILAVDELATISNHENIVTAMSNLRVGTKIFKMVGLANPESWEDPSCQYCVPENGQKVNVDTGHWRSTRGFFVRHYDGFKSPCVLHPELAEKFPFLLTKEKIEDTIRDADGNPDAPQVWKMVRGFPVPNNVGVPTVLDTKVAQDQKISEQCDADMMVGAVAAGLDPAWTEGGDGAIYQRVIVRQGGGKTVLDFSEGQRKLKILASDPRPVTQQLLDQTWAIMTNAGTYTAPLSATAVDASANQGLADDLDIYIGRGASRCVHVNNSMRASENPIRYGQIDICKDRYYDRGTEAWCVLAEFCKAGMVKGLPAEAVRALTQRRFAVKKGTTQQMYPLRLESKDDFKLRFKKSPDEADACALAALVVKEVLGVLPFGWLPVQTQPAVGDTNSAPQQFVASPLVLSDQYRDEAEPDQTYDPDYEGGF